MQPVFLDLLSLTHPPPPSSYLVIIPNPLSHPNTRPPTAISPFPPPTISSCSPSQSTQVNLVSSLSLLLRLTLTYLNLTVITSSLTLSATVIISHCVSGSVNNRDLFSFHQDSFFQYNYYADIDTYTNIIFNSKTMISVL